MSQEDTLRGRRPTTEAAMEMLYERCCGLDIHKRVVVACVIVPGPGGQPVKVVRHFGTMTDDLEHLVDWLAAHGVTQVAMESTGVYEKPVWNLRDDRFTLLVNARQVTAVPGRKTDIKDAEWLADLLRHGLLHPCVVPLGRRRPRRSLPSLTANRCQACRGEA